MFKFYQILDSEWKCGQSDNPLKLGLNSAEDLYKDTNPQYSENFYFYKIPEICDKQVLSNSGTGKYLAEVSVPLDAPVSWDWRGSFLRSNKLVLEKVRLLDDNCIAELNELREKYNREIEPQLHFGSAFISDLLHNVNNINDSFEWEGYTIGESYLRMLYETIILPNCESLWWGIPDRYKTQSICERAVEMHPPNLKFVPKKYITSELLQTAMRQSRHLSSVFETYINNTDNVDHKLCMSAVRMDGNTLKLIPDQYKTPELCIAAIKQTGKALAYVPFSMITEELCRLAVKNNALAMQTVYGYITHKAATDPTVTQQTINQFLEELVSLNGLSIRYLPTGLSAGNAPNSSISIGKNVVLAAVKQNGLAIQYIHESMIDTEVCEEALKQNVYAVQYISVQKLTPQLVTMVIGQDPRCLCNLPCVTPAVCLEVVKQNGLALKYISNQTADVCLEAVKQNGLALKYVYYHTLDICLEAVKQNGMALQYVVAYLQTDEVCREATKQNRNAVQFIKNGTGATVGSYLSLTGMSV